MIKLKTLWDLDKDSISHILNQLKKVRKNTQLPNSVRTIKKWYSILDTIIIAFEIIKREIEGIGYKFNDKEKSKLYKQNRVKVDTGLKLFSKYFREIWEK